MEPWLLLMMWINEAELKFTENPYSLLIYVTWSIVLYDGYGKITRLISPMKHGECKPLLGQPLVYVNNLYPLTLY